MSSANFRVRRATLDDLDTLRPMWESMRFTTAELERRLTEFQVAEDSEAQVVGGVGFQISERHARVHSETYADFSVADEVRPLIWQRLQALSLNHGIVRLWTQESSPFWKQNGFASASAEALKKMPSNWKNETSGWLTLPLKDEDSIVSGEKELALFMAAEKQRTARAFKHVRTLKTFATAVAILLALFVGVALFYIIRKNPALLNFGR
jgi:N-acetylglutamate synthase-like GNAT family acetyltransferase